ncbi:MAG TPA: ABC transporter permease [Longimicrobiales bacterium]|nr:ABC transporter permease [Longimicrobiales bacterium]
MTDDERLDRSTGHGREPADPEGGVHEAVPDPDTHPDTPAPEGETPRRGVPPGPAGVADGIDPATGESTSAGDRAATASEAPPGGASTGAVVLTAILPGAGHLLIGAPVRGLIFLLPWGTLLAAIWLGWESLTAIGETGSLDEWVALVTVAVGMLVVWVGAMRDMRAAAAGDARRDAAMHASDEPGVRADVDRTGDSQWSIAARHFRGNGLALIGLILMVLLYLIAFLAPLVAPYDPIAQGDLVTTAYLPPGLSHWMGTDQFGRDIMSRIIYGARISLAIGFIAVTIAIVLGSLLGAIAGYIGGKVDAAIMRFTDMVMAFPRLILLIMIIALFRPSLTLIILVLGLTQWPGTARLVRGEVLSLREQEYIQAARALGFGRWRIILRHLIPNVLAPVIVAATLGIGNTIVLEAGLSFLGMGIQPPTPSWGNLVSDGRQNLIGAWWVATFPGLAIVVTVLAFNLVGDGLRDALDPRLRS